MKKDTIPCEVFCYKNECPQETDLSCLSANMHVLVWILDNIYNRKPKLEAAYVEWNRNRVDYVEAGCLNEDVIGCNVENLGSRCFAAK